MKKKSSFENNKIYFPQLDSIRGMSFIAIFLFHTLQVNFQSGSFPAYLFDNLPFAIDVFFVLSSFLLTYLALQEYQKKNNFSFKNYFIRRILRIWPLYYSILLVAFLIIPSLAIAFHHKITLPPPLFYVFFVANFYEPDHIFFLKLLWTISVEEQFYLIWGCCLRFLNHHLKLVILVLYAVSISFSIGAIFNETKYYFNTLTYLFDFASGALAAFFIIKSKGFIRSVSNWSNRFTFLFYTYLLFHFVVFYLLNKITSGKLNDLAGLCNRYIFIAYISVFIAEQMINLNRTTILARSNFLIFTGKISYGLYCFHGITILMVNLLLGYLSIKMQNWFLVLIYFGLNFCIASLSYFYLEFPFLKLKKKWKRV